MKPNPTPLERRILSVLWDAREGETVHGILGRWSERKAPGYTTVLKTLQIMEGKGLVSHRRSGKSYIYTALLPREQAARRWLEESLSGLFRGERLAFMDALIRDMDLTEGEIREVRRMLSQKKKEEKP